MRDHFLLGFILALLLAMTECAPAQAETPGPCVLSPDKTQVICEREGFDRAVQKCSAAIGGEAACQVKLDAALKAWDDLKAKHDACVNATPDTFKPIAGYIAGLVGLSAAVLSPILPVSNEVKISMGAGGALLVAVGFWAVIP